MHVLIAGLYGFTIWLCALLVAVALRGDWVLVLWLCPVIVCGAMVFLWVADWVFWRLVSVLTRAARLVWSRL